MSLWCLEVPLPGNRAALIHLGILLCGLLPGLGAGPAEAAEWAFEPTVSLQTLYNDNIQLTPEAHSPVWGMKLSPDIRFSAATEALTVTGGLSLSFDRYFGDPQYNIDNYDLNLHSTYKADRDVFGLNIDGIRSSTLANELTTTGVVLAYSPQTQWIVAPSWSHALNERTFVNALYTFNNSNYSDTSGTSVTGNLDQLVSIGMQRNVNEGRVLNVALYYERFETRPAQTLQNNYGVRGGYDHAFSETLVASFLAGWRWTQSTLSAQALICDGPIVVGVCTGSIIETTAVQKQNNSGFTLNAVLTQQTETDLFRGELSQLISPSGTGSLVQTQRAGISWSRQWGPTLSSNIDASAYQTKYVGGIVTGSNSRYVTVNSRLSFRLDEWWRVDVGYNYARQKYDTAPVAASGNVVYVELNYLWPKFSMSR